MRQVRYRADQTEQQQQLHLTRQASDDIPAQETKVMPIGDSVRLTNGAAEDPSGIAPDPALDQSDD